MIELHGIKFQMPAAEYHAKHDYINYSTLKVIDKATVKRAVFERAQVKEQTESMAFGTAVHSAILTPEEYTNTYRVAPDCDKRTKDGKATYEKFTSSLEPHNIPISSENVRAIRSIVSSIADQSEICGVLDSCTHREVSMFDSKSSPKMRCRLDACDPSCDVIIDIKTMREPASEGNFRKLLNTYGYGLQAAFYMKVAKQLGANVKHFGFICIETTAPYEVSAFELDHNLLGYYTENLELLLQKYKEFEDSETKMPKTWDDCFKVLQPASWQKTSEPLF